MPVSQNIRRAVEALDNLHTLMLGLNKDPRGSDVSQELKTAIAEVLELLERFIDTSMEGGMNAVASELQLESSDRSEGQQARQARIDSCESAA